MTGPLGEHGHELGVHEVDLVDAALARPAGRRPRAARPVISLAFPCAGRVGEAAPLPGHLALAEPVPGDALAAGHERHRLDAALVEQRPQPLRLAQHVGVVRRRRSRGRWSGSARPRGPGSPARVISGWRICGDRLTTASTAQVISRAYGCGRVHPLLRLDDPRRRDQLLGAGDLGGGLDRPDPPPDRAKLCSHRCRRLLPGRRGCRRGGTYFLTASWSGADLGRRRRRRLVGDQQLAAAGLEARAGTRSIASLSAVVVSSDSSPVSLIAS